MMTDPHERLKDARTRAGYSSAAAAARAFGWTIPGYSHHENGTRGIGPDAAAKYARAFKTTANWLLFGEGAAPQPTDAPRLANVIYDDDGHLAPHQEKVSAAIDLLSELEALPDKGFAITLSAWAKDALDVAVSRRLQDFVADAFIRIAYEDLRASTLKTSVLTGSAAGILPQRLSTTLYYLDAMRDTALHDDGASFGHGRLREAALRVLQAAGVSAPRDSGTGLRTRLTTLVAITIAKLIRTGTDAVQFERPAETDNEKTSELD